MGIHDPAVAAEADCRNQIEISSITAAPHSPAQPMKRRVLAELPKYFSSGADTRPEKIEPSPPKNNGTHASSARFMSERLGKVSLMKVGIQVM